MQLLHRYNFLPKHIHDLPLPWQRRGEAFIHICTGKRRTISGDFSPWSIGQPLTGLILRGEFIAYRYKKR